MSSRLTVLVVLLAAPVMANAESIAYELYEVKDGKRILLTQGTRQYSQRDVLVEAHGSFSSREIPVANGFSAGVSIFPEPDISGFGLWLKDRRSVWGRISSGGFSWDWFDRESGDVYRKLQCSGRVRVIFVPSAGGKEISSVEVLEDLALRARVRPWFLSFLSHEDTHNMVVKKGSVLRFAP